MFSKTIIRLKSSQNGQYPEDEALQTQLRGLGFELQYKSDPITGSPEKVEILKIPEHQGKTVDPATTWHYRDRAYANISKMGNDSVTKEIERYAIYYGATSKFEASIAVTRVNQGEICIFVVQSKLDQCARCTEYVVNYLKKNTSGIFELDSRNASAIVQLFSTSSGANIASGQLVSRTFFDYLRKSTSETLVAFSLLLLAVITFLAGYYFPAYNNPVDGQIIDPLTASGRIFVERAWPASLISSMTAFLTLRLSFARLSRDGVEWDWKL